MLLNPHHSHISTTTMDTKMCRVLGLAIAVLFLSTSLASAACNKDDLKALLSFNSSFPPRTLYNWIDTEDCCSWDGIYCDDGTGRVTSLLFSNDDFNDFDPIDLVGRMPPSVGDLSELVDIRFSTLPNLVGPLPRQLSKLKKLKTINIYNTNLSGPIPSFLSQLPALERLDMSASQFTGSIPPSLGSLAKLRYVDLSRNGLTGSVPPSLFSRLDRSTLATLNLRQNKLAGAVPRSFASVAFSGIDLHENRLTGDARFLFGKSKPATSIDLAQNKLSFDLTDVEYPVGNLDYLDVSHNEIHGSISEQIKEATKLTYLDMSYNMLCGRIPSGGSFGNISSRDFSHNKCLCGTPLPPCKN
ncbi:polygalacturonase inhibitor-like [Iris pallida]|uniref:Polygalacturonase inhibitor-like n=1 Tax=Iris pallida TaxID=29817 RepID=A0AAX6EK26_IRIPA|nr:polygalacturonase inhibitor-like [Iris pallida]